MAVSAAISLLWLKCSILATAVYACFWFNLFWTEHDRKLLDSAFQSDTPDNSSSLYKMTLIMTTTYKWRIWVLYGNSVPLRSIEPARDKPNIPPRLAGWLAQLTAGAFNRLGQYASSPDSKAYCYAELAVFFPDSGKNRHYSFIPSRKDD